MLLILKRKVCWCYLIRIRLCALYFSMPCQLSDLCFLNVFLTLKLYTNPATLHGTSQVSMLTSSLEYDLSEPSHVDQNDKTHVVQNSVLRCQLTNAYT